MHHKITALTRAELQCGQPVVVHLNGLLFPLQARLLRTGIGPHVPLFAQPHGSLPWAHGIRRTVRKWVLSMLDRFLFATSALLDALACGVQPVLTAIPAFQKILNAGEVGRLWGRGDAVACCRALEFAQSNPLMPAEIRAFFDRNWHPDLIGAQAAAAYRSTENPQ